MTGWRPVQLGGQQEPLCRGHQGKGEKGRAWWQREGGRAAAREFRLRGEGPGASTTRSRGRGLRGPDLASTSRGSLRVAAGGQSSPSHPLGVCWCPWGRREGGRGQRPGGHRPPLLLGRGAPARGWQVVAVEGSTAGGSRAQPQTSEARENPISNHVASSSADQPQLHRYW